MVNANSSRRLLWLIIAVALLLRVGAALWFGDDVTNFIGGTTDQRSYDMLAQRVVKGHGFSFADFHWPYTPPQTPTAHWSFLYTSFLAFIYGIFNHHPVIARLAQAVILGVAMPLLTFRLGRFLISERIGLIAAAISAVYFYFVLFAASLMTEGFFFVTILWSFDAVFRVAERWRTGEKVPLRLALELGLAIGLSILLRQVIMFAHLFTALWLLWLAVRYRQTGSLVKTGVLATVVIGLLIAPWVVRNYRVFGRVSMPNTNSGFAFFWGNHPVYGGDFETVLDPARDITYQSLIPDDVRHLNESEMDAELTRRGLAFIRDNPAEFMRLSLSRVPVQFQFWPSARSSPLANAARFVSSGLLLPLAFAGIIIALRQTDWGGLLRERSAANLRQWSLLLLILYVAVYNGIHIVTWAKIRYRFPTDTVLVLFAALALVTLWQRSAEWRKSPRRLQDANA